MGSRSRPKVAVIGGGVLGVSAAQQLARGGADVVLVTEGELASNASGRSLSWLNSAGPHRADYHHLRMAGIDRYRTLAAQQPGLVWMRFDGGLAWLDASQAEQLRGRHEHQVARGYQSQLLSPDQVAALVPGVDPDAVPASGALWNPGEGWVDLPSLVRHLVQDFLQHGGALVTNAGAADVLTGGGGVTGVRTARGDRYQADAVLLATGAGVPATAAELGVTIPDATPLALLVTTRPVRTGLRAVLNSPRVSLRPTPDGGLAVDADWTAADIVRAADGRHTVPPATVQALLAEASRLLAGHPELEVERTGIGPKPLPGDGEPVLGPLGPVEGLYVAFTHSGATLGLIAGELLAQEVLGGTEHPLLAPFRAARFAQQAVRTPDVLPG